MTAAAVTPAIPLNLWLACLVFDPQVSEVVEGYGTLAVDALREGRDGELSWAIARPCDTGESVVSSGTARMTATAFVDRVLATEELGLLIVGLGERTVLDHVRGDDRVRSTVAWGTRQTPDAVAAATRAMRAGEVLRAKSSTRLSKTVAWAVSMATARPQIW